MRGDPAAVKSGRDAHRDFGGRDRSFRDILRIENHQFALVRRLIEREHDEVAVGFVGGAAAWRFGISFRRLAA